MCLYRWGKLQEAQLAGLPLDLAEFKQALQQAEEQTAEEAKKKLDELHKEHTSFTLAWVKATDLQQVVLKQEIERLEAAIHDWEPRAIPLTQRFHALHAAEEERQAERERLLVEWRTLENREKGEALRRLFNTVTLFWERTFHPASKKPTRPRKTDRSGRYSYALQRNRILWAFATSDLATSW